MRWWLSAVFVAIATVTAVLIASVSSRQAGKDLRANAESIAVGETVSAGFAIEQAVSDRQLGHEIVSIAGQHGLALFVFSKNRKMFASYGLRTVRWQDVPERNAALSSALADNRFVETFDGGRATVVALPLRKTPKAAAVVAYAPRPPGVAAANRIFVHEVVRASVWAVLVAVVTGLVAASLIARRLRRIATTARSIEEGDFAQELRPRFGDEVGQLAATINDMRGRLGDAFDSLSAERNRLVVLLEQLHEGVLAVDREGKVQFVNEQLGSILTGARFAAGEPLPETYEELPLRRLSGSLFAPNATHRRGSHPARRRRDCLARGHPRRLLRPRRPRRRRYHRARAAAPGGAGVRRQRLARAEDPGRRDRGCRRGAEVGRPGRTRQPRAVHRADREAVGPPHAADELSAHTGTRPDRAGRASTRTGAAKAAARGRRRHRPRGQESASASSALRR